ncbi:FHA domain-containing protein [Lysinibacter sp. HNR]|uniref:FHA domain-containing protein n=1 Tax=Lysinibacter sp. HNR TaxID=3031408 RepID=UPI002435D1CC|nr:FHA domain-containing protein [Lysinibacter sp. HNR]WGD37981.1 FHA domain-containing protein [Lysinibacter sp. HNR]
MITDYSLDSSGAVLGVGGVDDESTVIGGLRESGRMLGSAHDDFPVDTTINTPRGGGTRGSAIEAFPPRLATPPVASVLFPDGNRLWLNRPLVLGRCPQSSGVVGGTLSQLIRVPSPRGVVSSTHAQIRQEGEVVIVTDLYSTNGTVVIFPRKVPRRLRPGETVAVAEETVIDLGDGMECRILIQNGEEKS